jgi:butanol dehydrogenase
MEKFKLKMPTNIIFGTKEFSKVKNTSKSLGKIALIVIGKGSVKKYGYLENLENILKKENIKTYVFEGIEPNPRRKTINKAGTFAKSIGAEMIIALGGGSVMDASKGIAIVAKEGRDVWEYCMVKGKETRKVKEALPIICIPTVAATGSEVDKVSVITNMETKQKASLHDEKVIPKFAIIDPELIKTVPKNYLVDGGMDVMCHALETYLSSLDKTPLQDYITLSITKTVKDALNNILEEKNMEEERENLCLASSYAMLGILSGRRGGWPIHLIEHSISAIYDISHGLGLSHILIPYLKHIAKENSKKINEFIGFTLHGNLNHYDNTNKAIEDFKLWMEKVGALRDFKIRKEDLNVIAKNVIDTYSNKDGYIFGLNPIYKEDIIKIISKFTD